MMIMIIIIIIAGGCLLSLVRCGVGSVQREELGCGCRAQGFFVLACFFGLLEGGREAKG